MALREITIKPHEPQAMPKDGLITKSYRIGRRFGVTFNQRVEVGVALVSSLQVWKPHTPTWDELSGAERGDYRWARNHFAQAVANTTGKEVVILESDAP